MSHRNLLTTDGEAEQSWGDVPSRGRPDGLDARPLVEFIVIIAGESAWIPPGYRVGKKCYDCHSPGGIHGFTRASGSKIGRTTTFLAQVGSRPGADRARDARGCLRCSGSSSAGANGERPRIFRRAGETRPVSLPGALRVVS